MNSLLVAMVLAATPVAGGPEECLTAADMLLVSRAMVEERMTLSQITGVMIRVYNKAAVDKWGAPLIRYAIGAKRSAEVEATEFANYCMANGGNVNKLLGEPV